MERYWSFFVFLSILSKFHRKMNRNSSWLLSPLSCLTQITIIQFHWWQKKKRLNRRQNKRPAKSKTILQLHFSDLDWKLSISVCWQASKQAKYSNVNYLSFSLLHTLVSFFPILLFPVWSRKFGIMHHEIHCQYREK